MHPIKWLRKNNMKVMAVVIVVLMIGFIGGSYIQQLGRSRATGLKNTVAFFADNKKITNYDLVLARQDLAVLSMLLANRLLVSTQDLLPVLLGELLFSERSASLGIINYIQQLIVANNYAINAGQLNDIYRRPLPPELYWLLLKKETEQAGFKVSNEQAGQLLGIVIPQLFPNTTYKQLIGSIIANRGIPQEKILETFGSLMAVMEYARTTCSNENVTNAQLMHNAICQHETMDVEFVKFDSELFTENRPAPTQQQISEQFDKYKSLPPGEVSEENPYGFGYKIPDRIRLEYLAVKLDDIEKITTPPKQQEIEDLYQKRKDLFREQVPSDPNDPNSPPVERIKSFGEVAELISKQMLQDKINVKADSILQDAKALTDSASQNTDLSTLTPEQLRQAAGDYETAADQLSKKHNIKIYTGSTGLLSTSDIHTNKDTSMLYLRPPGSNPTGLVQVAFAVEPLAASELGPFDAPRPRLFENIGPLRDGQRKIMALVRVIDVQKAAVPDSLNYTYNKKSFDLSDEPLPPELPDKNTYSVEETVAQDLKRLAAMDAAGTKAEEFVRSVTELGWQDSIDKFNRLYGSPQKQGDDEPNAFELRTITNLQRTPAKTIRTMDLQSKKDPVGRYLFAEDKKNVLLTDRLYSLVPQTAEAIDTLPLVMEFKPDMSCFVIKNININRLDRRQYDTVKAGQAYKETFVNTQSLAAAHFAPENILKRTGFRFADQTRILPDANSAPKTEESM